MWVSREGAANCISIILLEDQMMKRRDVLKPGAGLAATAALPPASAREGFVDFSPELYSEMLESGKPFLLGFLSDW